MKSWTLVGSAILAAGCSELPQLATPEPGSCPEVIENTWPAFEGVDERPVWAEVQQGYELGLIAPDFNLVDFNGNETCLWQFVGKYVVLDTSALWCGPCRDIAEKVPCIQGAYGDDVVYVTLITEGGINGTDSTFEDVVNWTRTYGLDAGGQTPVLLDSGGVYAEGFPGDSLPAFLLLDRELRVISSGSSKLAELDIRNELDARLGIDSHVCDE